MTGSISILDSRTGDRVAVLQWEGTLWRGKGEWKADAHTRKRLEAIVASRSDLGRVQFSDMLRDGFGVKGWQGFSGWVQALTLALPAFGMAVDYATIQWPWKPPAPGYVDVEPGDENVEAVRIVGGV